MSVHVYDVFMEVNRYTLDKSKEKIKLNFSIQFSGKVKKFLRVYYEWGCDAKGLYAKITTGKDVKKFVEGYEKHNESDVKVQK